MVQQVLFVRRSALADRGVIQSKGVVRRQLLPLRADVRHRPLGQQRSCGVDPGLEQPLLALGTGGELVAVGEREEQWLPRRVEPALERGGPYPGLDAERMMSDNCSSGWIAEIGSYVM